MLKNSTVNIALILIFLLLMAMDVFSDMSVWWYLLIIALYSLLQAYGSIILSAQFFVPVKFQGNANDHAIAITFDDGPIAGRTEKILDVLKSKDALATFFCIGNRVKETPDLAKRIHHEGHVIGNHSYWHGKMFDLQLPSAISAELMNTDGVIESVTGVRPLFFRPPYGVTNPMVAGALNETKHTVVGWTVRSFDTITKDPDSLFKKVTSGLKSGDIVLFHDYCESTLEILPAFIDHVRNIGLKIVTVDVLLNESPYAKK
jgi:peptidoglycan-N-acetylglucosamine deacetylase